LPNQTMSSDGRPFFSWDHMPVYTAVANHQAGGLSDELVGFLATHPLAFVTLDKFEDVFGAPLGRNGEDKLAATAVRLKSINPALPVVFYQNSIKDHQYYSFFCKTRNMLLETHGQLVTISTHFSGASFPIVDCVTGAVSHSDSVPVMDLTNPALIAAWQTQMQMVANYTFNGARLFSGMFLDLSEKSAAAYSKGSPGWIWLTPAQVAHYDAGHKTIIAQAASVFSFTITNNKDWTLAGHVFARQYEQFMLFDVDGLSMYKTILDMQAQAASGRVMAANSSPCGPNVAYGQPVTIQLLGNTVINKPAEYVRAISMAGFLVAACHYSYYSCTGGYDDGYEQQIYHDCWHAEYNQPLGAPLGRAKHVSIGPADYFFRQFASGTQAFVMTASRNTLYEGAGCVCWSDGSSTCSGSMSCASFYAVFKSRLSEGQLAKWAKDGCQ